MLLHNIIANRQPLTWCFTAPAYGSQQSFQVSGEPMFDRLSRFVGYRGIGLELQRKPSVWGLT